MGAGHQRARTTVTAAAGGSAAAPAEKPVCAIIDRAEDLAAAGRLHDVATLLRPALAQLSGHAVTAEALDAAVLYAHALTGTGHPAVAAAWAGWAHTRSHRHRDRGPGHPTTIRALGVAAAALLADHRPRQSAARYRNLVAALTTTSGPAGGLRLGDRILLLSDLDAPW
ncbi:hypothetical protein [Micromonospora aurantiaca (nom. illeg.)]|uniref:hypothetical protein n=1 Tax=Micromonospora aurantiaca (nom. illeg.) TaxID=47850 RepID=UPI0001BF570D|nr:hypothetical protein [Micromonospora aurantiaca]ADL47608.1 hypothetical protein Micau_4092 [Micromonospora aurantiaca ATCC 27029]